MSQPSPTTSIHRNAHQSADPHRVELVYLKGSEAQMGAQHGELVRDHAHFSELITYFQKLPTQVIRASLPPAVRRRPLVSEAINGIAGIWNARMAASRPIAQQQRTAAFMRAAGRRQRDAHAGFAMDVLQNMINVVSPLQQQLEQLGPRRAALAACTSVAAWDRATQSGHLLHARNFDFPAPGVWNRAPSVVFCRPADGINYGFVTTSGGDTPCVTVFNEAGLVITPHTRFHRHIALRGIGIVDLCHEIARSASSLFEAQAIVRRHTVNSTWGILVSSARERSAMVIETTGRDVRVVRPGSKPYQVNTNHYGSAPLQRGQVNPVDGFVRHTRDRFDRASSLIEGFMAADGASTSDLCNVLGDHQQAQSGLQVIGGDVISNPLTVQSVVVDAEAGVLHLATGQAPVGNGSYVQIPWHWPASPGTDVVSAETPPQLAADPAWQTAIEAYASAARLDLEHRDPVRAAQAFAAATAALPADPAVALISGGIALRRGDLRTAERHFEQAADTPQDPERRAQARRWHTATTLARRGPRSRQRGSEQLATKIRQRAQHLCIDYTLLDLSL